MPVKINGATSGSLTIKAPDTGSDVEVDLINSLAAKAPLVVEINSQTQSYTLALSDQFKQVEVLNASANTVTVPPDSSVNFPVGTTIVVVQTGAGQTTIAAGSGVTINSTPGLKLRSQWSVAVLTKRLSNTWLASGDLAA